MTHPTITLAERLRTAEDLSDLFHGFAEYLEGEGHGDAAATLREASRAGAFGYWGLDPIQAAAEEAREDGYAAGYEDGKQDGIAEATLEGENTR